MLDKLLTILNGTLTKLALLTDKHAKAQQKQSEDIKAAIAGLTAQMKAQKAPVVKVEAPKVEVTVPDVIVPKIESPVVNVTVPEIKIPPITVPEPKVTVNVPEVKIPPFPAPIVNVEAPIVNVDNVKVTGFSELAKSLLASLKALAGKSIHDDVDRLNPIPVIQVDENGNVVKNKGGGGAVMYQGGAAGPQDEGFGIPKHDERVLGYDGDDKLQTITYKLSGATVATLTLTRNGAGKITNVVRT